MAKFHKLRDTTSTYYTTDNYFFPMMEEKIGEITSKNGEIFAIMENSMPSRFPETTLYRCGQMVICSKKISFRLDKSIFQ